MEIKLTGLKEIALPEQVSYMPQTMAWYILFGLILFSIFWLGLRWYHRWTVNRYRREALKRLAEIQRSIATPISKMSLLTSLPVLVKQVTLAFTSRESVARLSGNDWLTFLDSTYRGKNFTDGAGKMLPEISYQPATKVEKITDQKLADLFDLLEKWIRRHRAHI